METTPDRTSLPAAGPESADVLLAPAAILEGLPDAVVATGEDERIVFVNALAEELFGYPRVELVGQPVQMLWPERVRQRYTRNMRLYFATEDPLRFSIDVRGLRRDGTEFVGEMSWGIVRTNGGPLLLAIGRDITARRRSDSRSRHVAALGQRALAGADAPSLAAEAVDALQNCLSIVGAAVRLADGTNLATTGPACEPGLRLPIGTGDILLLAPAAELDDAEVSFVRAVANTLATALERLRGEEQTRHQAVHDVLTGLANRMLLRDRLEHALARSRRECARAAVLFIDVDGFKQVNDRHGHAAGDAVLIEIAHRLDAALRPGDTVARFGGDEFVAVCENVDEEEALIVGVRVLEALRRPLSTSGVGESVSACIGIALGDHDPEGLIDNADAAAYRAKAAGRGRVELF